MTLLITILAAVVTTLIWYSSEKARELRISTLVFMFWGASLMWFVDAVFEFAELKAEYFTPEPLEMLNDFFLGISVVALGLIIWLIILLIRDPRGVIKKMLSKKEA